MQTDEVTKARYLRQHQQRSKQLSNGDLTIHIQGGVYDLFTGEGWDGIPIRFRIVKFRDKSRTPQLLQISTGSTLTREYRELLIKELT